jgi:aminomethyltransferase
MKNTVFIKFHEAAGARMVPFAGYNMPVEYTGITEEHIIVRESVGVFDVSHMGEFWVSGPSALQFLQYITSTMFLHSGTVRYNIHASRTVKEE